jgi:hypothetical protein
MIDYAQFIGSAGVANELTKPRKYVYSIKQEKSYL